MNQMGDITFYMHIGWLPRLGHCPKSIAPKVKEAEAE